MFPLLLILAQEPTTPPTAPVAPVSLDLKQVPVVAETARIRLSPVLDGKLADEEWDPLTESNGVKTYFEWEPGKLHIAAAPPVGHDLLVSVDPGADGWLVGRNNLEARVTLTDGKPVISVRYLDATNVSGPVYRNIAGLNAPSQAAIGGDGTIEFTLTDPGLDLLPKGPGKLSLRVDVIPTATPDLEPNTPRALTPLSLVTERASGLPSGLKGYGERFDTPVIPGEEFGMRFTFKGEPMPTRVSLRTEGVARTATSATETPFDGAGKKSAGVDYRTQVAKDALPGYRIARAVVSGTDGVPGVVQVSYRIASLVDLDLTETQFKPSEKDRSLRLGFSIKGNTRKRLEGQLFVTAPEGFRITNGDDMQKILLAEPRLPLRKGIDLVIPANALGTYPIVFKFKSGKETVDLVRYITIS